MHLYLKKFGKTLTSREDGREAFAAIQPSLGDDKGSDKMELNFEGVNTFTPSWGDEFLTPFLKKYGDRLILLNIKNPSVIATIKMLEKIHTISFNKK